MKNSMPAIATHYRQMQIGTASHSKAICMLHQRCMQLIELGRRNPGEQRENLDKAQNILAQLQRVLDKNDEVSESLFLLYDYCYALLERGAPNECRNALTIIRHLTFTFRALSRRT